MKFLPLSPQGNHTEIKNLGFELQHIIKQDKRIITTYRKGVNWQMVVEFSGVIILILKCGWFAMCEYIEAQPDCELIHLEAL
jgi:hypothetical protein